MLTLSGHVPDTSAIARGVFVALLLSVVVWDITARRIPNVVSGALALAGLVAALLGLGSPAGIWGAVGGLIVGLLLWLPGYALGMVGAGDVKLFAAASAWLTPAGACWAALGGALVGAVVAIGTYLWSHGLSLTALRLGNALHRPQTLAEPMPSARGRDARVPYGVSLVAGVLLQAFVPRWHLWIS